MQTKLLYFLFSMSAIWSTKAQSQTTYPDSVQEKINSIEKNLSGWVQIEGIKSAWTLQERMKHYHVNGLSIAVIHNYKLEWAKGYGWADAASQIRVTPQTVFQAASISKSLNAVGVLKLAQEHKINLREDINTYLKSWHLPASKFAANKKITVYNLLNHTAGLNVHGFEGYEKGDSLPSILEILKGEKPANSPAIQLMTEPGTTVEYSGGGIEISQLIVMDVTHRSYEEYQQSEVLKPLGMTNSFYSFSPPVAASGGGHVAYFPPPHIGENQQGASNSLATAYDRDGKELKGKYHLYPESAAAGLWTTPTDLSKFIIGIQLAYEGKSNNVLSQPTTQEMLTPFNGSDAGLGMFVDTIGDRVYFKHSGANEGFRCQYFGSLTGGDGVVVMVNSDQDVILHDVVNGIAQIYHWNNFSKTQTRKPIQVPADTLQQYTGNYNLDGETMSVTNNNGMLYFSLNGSAPMRMYFTSSTSFFFMEIQMNNIRFEKNSTGKFYDIVLKSGDHDVRFVKE